MAISPTLNCASSVEAPTWGDIIKFGNSFNFESAGSGSTANTSKPAALIFLSLRTLYHASSSTIPPLAALIKMASFFIIPKSSAETKPLVCAVNGV